MMNLHIQRLRGVAAATLLALAAGHAAAEPADGVLDPNFGTDGIAMVAFDTAPANPIDVALDAVVDSFGRTYLVGVAMTSDGQRIAITRLRADGTLDTNYGPDDVGLVVAPEQLGFSLTGASAAIAPDGRLLVGGTLTTNGNQDFALCRFDIDGSLDAFPNGLQCVKVAFDLNGAGGTKADVLGDIAVQPDGRIVLVGSANFSATLSRAAFARLDTNGDLDNSFNGTGRNSYTVPNGVSAMLNSVAIARNGKLVAAGETVLEGFSDTDFLVMRMEPDGTIDETFAEDGFAVLYPIHTTRNHAFRKVILEPGHPQIVIDQQIVAVGSIESDVGSDLYEGIVARIDADGTPTAGYGTGGTGYRVDNTGHHLVFNDAVRESNGNLLVAGTIRANSNPATTLDYYVTRLLPDGSTDQDGFNPPTGFSLVNLDGSNDLANAIALRHDRIIVAGTSLVGTVPPNTDFSAIGLLRDRIFANGYD
jgi:uncharacterized delta-60 repeat protein